MPILIKTLISLLLIGIPQESVFFSQNKPTSTATTPVAYISDTDKAPASSTSFTYTSFAVSGTNPGIAVLVALDVTVNGTRTLSVATSAGLTGTVAKAATVTTNSDTQVDLWCITAPSGTGTITVSWTGSAPYQSNAILFQHTNQTTMCPTGAGNVGTASTNPPNPLTITLANLTSNDACIGMGANSVDGDNPQFQQTQTFANNTSNVNAAGGYHLGTGACSVLWGTTTSNATLAVARVASE